MKLHLDFLNIQDENWIKMSPLKMGFPKVVNRRSWSHWELEAEKMVHGSYILVNRGYNGAASPLAEDDAHFCPQTRIHLTHT